MRHALLLRGINLGPTRRVPMAELRTLFTAAGYEDVRTYVQSGNLVLGSAMAVADLEREAERLIAERFGFDVAVIARTQRELGAIVKLNPLADVADDPKRYQVSFLAGKPTRDLVVALQAKAAGSERLVAHGRELYAWHPNGVARSKLWNALAGKGLKITATARNWTTVTTLLEMTQS